jgi:Hairy Orange
MRKGRGRVEKTEIIEMAIRHLKNLQTQEVLREATYAEHYRSGYNDCVSEAAKFLLRERDEELYYKMITHLRDHMPEPMKGKENVSCQPELATIFFSFKNNQILNFRRNEVRKCRWRGSSTVAVASIY